MSPGRDILLLLASLLVIGCGVRRSMRDLPDTAGMEQMDTSRIRHGDTHFTLGKNSLYKNQYGIWELYLEGNALERGLANGSLTRELIKKQEKAFMGTIQEQVPSESYRNLLKKLVSWFNRKMYLHVPEEYKQEIYGLSRFAPDTYDDFAAPYLRMLYYHGAHDIGHALKDLMLVGCTSFAAWGEKTEDGELLVGRNFDFYAGDEFSREKIVAFVHPNKGHKFMMYTWPGMIGVVSGMNEKGISVTINAGKSRIPLLAKTPISLVAREILQYASSTGEAIAIARKREVFVSESIMVGSGREQHTILIEVAPKKFGIHQVRNSNRLICSNHFQSDAYADDPRNNRSIRESHSMYRQKRMEELLENHEKLAPQQAVRILRNKQGLGDQVLGYGNEKAINQLLAHHGIVFKPAEKKVWVSANPYQLGAFVAYDLEKVFSGFSAGGVTGSLASLEETIARDPFVDSRAFEKYEQFRHLSREIRRSLKAGIAVAKEKVEKLKQLNPEFWKAYALAGDYYYQQKSFKKAVVNYKLALRREVSSLPEVQHLEKRIKKSYRNMSYER